MERQAKHYLDVFLGLSLSQQKAVSRHPERNEVKPKDLLFSLFLGIFLRFQRKSRFFDSGCISAQNDGFTPVNDTASPECYCKAKVLALNFFIAMIDLVRHNLRPRPEFSGRGRRGKRWRELNS
jgi:hypothetical protein